MCLTPGRPADLHDPAPILPPGQRQAAWGKAGVPEYWSHPARRPSGAVGCRRVGVGSAASRHSARPAGVCLGDLALMQLGLFRYPCYVVAGIVESVIVTEVPAFSLVFRSRSRVRYLWHISKYAQCRAEISVS